MTWDTFGLFLLAALAAFGLDLYYRSKLPY